MEKRFLVKGMSCGHCQKSVEDALNALPEVDEVGVDLGTGLVSVIGDQLVDEKIVATIEDLGFDVAEVMA